MEGARKCRTFKFRLSEAEYTTIKARAAEASLSMAAYLRARALGKRVMSSADKHTINELRRLGGLVKHLFTEGRVQPDQSAEALRELVAAVRRIGRAGE